MEYERSLAVKQLLDYEPSLTAAPHAPTALNLEVMLKSYRKKKKAERSARPPPTSDTAGFH